MSESIIFYRIPKNASTSIYDKLGSLNFIKKHDSIISVNVNQKIYKNFFTPSHLKPHELFNIIGPTVKKHFSFCVVRNPWDRVVSMYKFATKYKLNKLYDIRDNLNFLDFCNILNDHKNDKYFLASHLQSEWAFDYPRPNKILKFENIQEDFEKMAKNANLNLLSNKLPHLNDTEHSHYSDYYNRETKLIVYNLFEQDIDNFKYTFNSECFGSPKPKESKGSLRI